MTSESDKSHDGRTHKPLIVAVIPCFDEERFIGSVVLKVKKYVDRVLVIDDGSSDASAEVAASAGAVVFRHDCNRGLGAALRTAFQKAKEMGADIVVRLDADGQHDGDDIPAVIAPILRGEADVVVGSRFMGGRVRAPLYRRVGQRVLTATTNLGSGTRIKDSQSGFRAFSAKALEGIAITEDGFSAESEMQFAIARSGLRVVEVPIAVIYADKAKRNPVGHGVTVLTRVLVLISLRQPMIIFGVPGLCLVGGGIGMGLHVLDVYAQTRELGLGNAMITVLLALTGMLCLFTAVILQSMKELLRGAFVQLEREASGYLSLGKSGKDGIGPGKAQ